MPMNAKELADHIARQIEEAAQMGEPPSFAFENRWDADSLLAILRAVDGSSEAPREEAIRMDECHKIMKALDSYPHASDYGPPIQERIKKLDAAMRQSATEGKG